MVQGSPRSPRTANGSPKGISAGAKGSQREPKAPQSKPNERLRMREHTYGRGGQMCEVHLPYNIETILI